MINKLTHLDSKSFTRLLTEFLEAVLTRPTTLRSLFGDCPRPGSDDRASWDFDRLDRKRDQDLERARHLDLLASFMLARTAMGTL